eukprot:6939964-Ditylum_brightwellii.AAC.1
MAVHQCARYLHNLHCCHKKAVKRIVHYLISTRDMSPGKESFRGMIINPTGDLFLDCYVDSNFAILWGYEDSQDHLSVRSRTGFVLISGTTPILWVSKLQTEIA